jgi:hypothetical protein
MVLQCPGWRRDGGDGRAGPMVTEETRLIGLTSRRGPGQAWNKRPSPFEGSAVLFRGCGVSTVREWAAQCHGADTRLAAQCRTVAGMASPGELAEQRRDMIPKRVRGTAQRGSVFDPCACKCQNVKCPCRGSRCGGGEPVRASSEAEPHPRGRAALERGGDSLARRCAPQAKRSFARGWLGRLFWWAAGATRAVGPVAGP